MIELLTIFILAIALSMDTFSLSLSIGTLDLAKRKMLVLSILVGVMHFIMPLLGLIIGNEILRLVPLNPKYLISLILFILAILMIKDLGEDNSFKLSFRFLEIFLFSLSVSLDSFSTGIGLSGITSHYLISFILFSMCSASFTLLGLIIGKYSHNKLGKKANIIGIVLLISISLIHLLP